MKYHDIFEEKEINYRKQLFENYEKKKSKKEMKKDIEKSQNEYRNLYKIFDLDGGKNNIDDEINDKNIRFIKIRLDNE
jgi:hypothetical protein